MHFSSVHNLIRPQGSGNSSKLRRERRTEAGLTITGLNVAFNSNLQIVGYRHSTHGACSYDKSLEVTERRALCKRKVSQGDEEGRNRWAKRCDEDLVYSTMSTLLQRIDSSLRRGEGTLEIGFQFSPFGLSIRVLRYLVTMAFPNKKLINDSNDVMTEFIEGFVETYPGLQYLDGFPLVKVKLRADVSSATYDKVAVISRGGSGLEPAHVGFVGEGMLTATICLGLSPPIRSGPKTNTNPCPTTGPGPSIDPGLGPSI
ncbi:hypothetical protein VNO77_27181 [Canavalia gladiata]|uniref:DhaK domain-containing protein n=1 Tax=Canavalia gladiata TaxID=3824 RepID=A0AAN9KYD2_CANGL